MPNLKEGDFAMTAHGSDEEVHIGQVVHVMREGMLGIPGGEYSLEASEENPAVLIQLFEQEENGYWEATNLYTACMMSLMVAIDPLPQEPEDSEVAMAMHDSSIGKADDLFEDDDTVEYDTDTVSKAEGYSPPAGARSAARKAIKFKEDGKANGAGTAVGWTRAGQLARGETISLSTVKRMYSYFSRHEVDKKGKDWGNSSNPSNGYIMWLAWGGDAGFSWSKSIVNREKDKALFANFGKEYTNSQSLKNIFR
jgi:hypothetical protein